MRGIFTSIIIMYAAALANVKVNAAKCHPDDEAGLLGFKSSIRSDPSGMLSKWIAGTDCCKWYGVDCPINSNRVHSLSLYGDLNSPQRFLSGTISPSLSKLQFLDGLYLVDLLNITGPFPAFLLTMPNLLYIYIENSKLSGPIPDIFANSTRKLGALSLAGNRFTGPIPNSISHLTALTQLVLNDNLLTGLIPQWLQRLKDLSYLNLEGNQLSGNIPDVFSSLKSLGILRLSRNKLTGTIPPSIAALSPTLQFLQLGHNSLSGKIPDFLGKFRTLDTLDLSSNRFEGTVPQSFRNLTKIFNLNLSNNLLVDPFPDMNVKGIESLDLSNNKFHLGKIPKWVASSPIIFSLKLANCGIKIRLEDWKPSETYFYDFIDLSGNEVSGSAIGLVNSTEYLVGFWASGNKLRFDLEGLRIVERLKYLDLSRNAVFGKVPNGVAALDKLNLSYNHLCGQLPNTKFPATAFLGNDCLCGSPLPPCK